MPVLAMSAGRVAAIVGHAYVKQPDGTLKKLQVGDTLPGGTRVITDEQGMVEIVASSGTSLALKKQGAMAATDKAIAGIEAQVAGQSPAAGLEGGADGILNPGLRVDRVSEGVARSGGYVYSAAEADANIPAGSSADQRLLAGRMIEGMSPDDHRPRVDAVEVLALDGGHLYFGITLTHASASPVQLRLALTPAEEAGGDLWGRSFYALEENRFLPVQPLPGEAGDAVIIVVPPSTPVGQIILKLPFFVSAEAEGAIVDVIRLDASTQYDVAPRSAQLDFDPIRGEWLPSNPWPDSTWVLEHEGVLALQLADPPGGPSPSEVQPSLHALDARDVVDDDGDGLMRWFTAGNGPVQEGLASASHNPPAQLAAVTLGLLFDAVKTSNWPGEHM